MVVAMVVAALVSCSFAGEGHGSTGWKITNIHCSAGQLRRRSDKNSRARAPVAYRVGDGRQVAALQLEEEHDEVREEQLQKRAELRTREGRARRDRRRRDEPAPHPVGAVSADECFRTGWRVPDWSRRAQTCTKSQMSDLYGIVCMHTVKAIALPNAPAHTWTGVPGSMMGRSPVK